MFVDYYEILGIEIRATEDQIKKAYRLNAIKYHPDKHFDDPFFTKKFQEVQEAYVILTDYSKRSEFDLLYIKYYQISPNNNNTYSNPQNNSYAYTNYKQQNEDRKKTEKQQEEKFRYDPYKQFYSPFDREQQETPQFNPTINIWGEKLNEKLEFFKLPKRIGKIIAGFSDLVEDTQPYTSGQKAKKNFIYIIVGLLISTAIYFLFNLKEPVWVFIWFAVPVFISLYFSTAVTKFRHSNYYVGINGFAHFVCEDSRERLIVNTEVNFNDVTDFYSYYTDINRNYVYQQTNFVYVFLNKNNGKIAFAQDGNFNKKTAVKLQGQLLNFYRTIERYWTVYLLDRLENDLQQKGHVIFTLYSHQKNSFQQYIKLGIGFITFIKTGGQEFTYRFNDIKKIYIKGAELRIQHKNFEKTLFFFKSGNEDVIPMTNLCNRQFFYNAIEILLGYSIK